MTRRIDWPENVFHAGASRAPTRRGDPARRRAELPLARPSTRSSSTSRASSGRARRHARRAPRRRPAYPPGARHRLRQRRLAGRGARAAAVALRGPDRHRRRPPRRLPAGGDPLGQPVVGGAALRLARAEPARGARPVRPPRRAARRRRSPWASSRRRRRSTREQISEAVASDPETADYVEELERRADTIEEMIDEPTSRPASRSPPS